MTSLHYSSSKHFEIGYLSLYVYEFIYTEKNEFSLQNILNRKHQKLL